MVLNKSLMLTLLLAFASGCFSTKMTQTAEPLGAGNGEIALSWNTTQISNLGDQPGSLTLPSLLPNAHFALGVADNVDVFANLSIASWSTDIGVKYVPIRTESGSFALAPYLGLSPWGALASSRLGLPIMYTRKLNPKLLLTVMGEGLYRKRGAASADSWESGWVGNLVDTFGGDTIGVGGGIGLEFRGRALSIRPALSYTYYTAQFDGAEDSVNVGIGQFGLTFARANGRVEAQLDRIEEKIDALAE
jgi:hypothetical protein